MPLLNLLTQCPILQNPLAKGATQQINMHHKLTKNEYNQLRRTLGICIVIIKEKSGENEIWS